MRLSAIALGLITAGLSAPSFAQSEGQPLEEIYVYGQKAMMQNALNRQRDSDVVKSVVTRDSIGNFPDQNVAEAVRRLAGVNVLNDQGEGRFVAVRGLDPKLNSSSVNGTRLPSPESDTRAVALDVIASELVEAVEVVKTLTPDMDADTIGASINIETTSAFEVEEPFLSVKLEQQYNDLNEEYSPKGSVDFIYPVNDRFGIAGGFSYSERQTSTDNIESEGWGITDSGALFADAIEYRDYDVLRERTGFSLKADYVVNDSTELFAHLMYSEFEDTEQRRRLVMEFAEEPTSGDSTSAVFLSDDGEIAVDRGLKDRYEAQTIQTFAVGGKTVVGPWRFDYSASLAQAEEHEHKTQDPTRFSAKFEDPGALAVSFNYADMMKPSYSILAGSTEFFDAATYEIDKLELVDALSEDEEMTLKFDVTRTFELASGSLDLKGGVQLRSRTKEQDFYLELLEDYAGDYTLADVLGQQSYGLAVIDPMPSLSAVRAFNAANLSGFELNQYDTDLESNVEDFEMEEDIFATYAMARWSAGDLALIGGVRFEATDYSVRANRTEEVEEGAVRNGVTLEEDTLFISATRDSDDYLDVLPSLSMRYDLSDDVVLRAGFFQSVVRPTPTELAPIFIVAEAADGEREGEFGNSQLEPYEAMNFDASLEYYFSPQGAVQVGVFYKTIDNFIYQREFEAGDAPYNGVYNNVNFDVMTVPLNGEEATVTGLEFAYQHALTMLPAPFNGLLVGLNYTYTDTEGDIGDRTIPLPAAAESTWNAMIGYEAGPASVRLTAAYRDSYLDEVAGDPEEDRYVQDHTQIDLTASYNVRDNVRLYVQLANLNDEPYVAYQPGPSSARLLQYEEYSWNGRFGIQVTF